MRMSRIGRLEERQTGRMVASRSNLSPLGCSSLSLSHSLSGKAGSVLSNGVEIAALCKISRRASLEMKLGPASCRGS